MLVSEFDLLKEKGEGTHMENEYPKRTFLYLTLPIKLSKTIVCSSEV